MGSTPKEILEWSQIYGLGIVLSVIIASVLCWVIWYVLRENTKREERLCGLVEIHIAKLADNVSNVKEGCVLRDSRYNEIKTANDFQRKEHQEMIEVLKAMRDDMLRHNVPA